MSIAVQGRHADGHLATDDERRRDLLQVVALYASMTETERDAEHYSHVTHACPIDQDTNDGQHWMGVVCPLCNPPLDAAPDVSDDA